MVSTIPIIANHLKYPPLKPKKIPDRLVWHSVSEIQENIHEFHMFTTSSKSTKTALMRCCKLRYEKPCTMYITLLMSNPPNNGMGREMLKIAERFSRECDCEGRIRLKATAMFDPNRIPHIFYRKNGFTTKNPKIDKRLDRFIKNNRCAKHTDFDDMVMYYDPNEKVTPKTTFWEKMKKIFS